MDHFDESTTTSHLICVFYLFNTHLLHKCVILICFKKYIFVFNNTSQNIFYNFDNISDMQSLKMMCSVKYTY